MRLIVVQHLQGNKKDAPIVHPLTTPRGNEVVEKVEDYVFLRFGC